MIEISHGAVVGIVVQALGPDVATRGPNDFESPLGLLGLLHQAGVSQQDLFGAAWDGIYNMLRDNRHYLRYRIKELKEERIAMLRGEEGRDDVR